MAQNNAQLSKNLADKGAKNVALSFQAKADKWYASNAERLRDMAGDMTEVRKIFAIAIQTINRTPALLECTEQSVFACIAQSMAFGLLPGFMQECGYVPLNNKKTGKKEANFWPMYQGLVKLAFHSGIVARVASGVVWSSDEFTYEDGLELVLRHRPFAGPREQRGVRQGVWAVIKLTSGENQGVYLSHEHIAGVKAKAPGAGTSDSPWNSKNPDDVDWMWKKTALKQVIKLIPKTERLAQAIEVDNALENPSLARPAVFNFSNPASRDIDVPDATDGEDQGAEGEEDKQPAGNTGGNAPPALPAPEERVEIDLAAKAPEPTLAQEFDKAIEPGPDEAKRAAAMLAKKPASVEPAPAQYKEHEEALYIDINPSTGEEEEIWGADADRRLARLTPLERAKQRTLRNQHGWK